MKKIFFFLGFFAALFLFPKGALAQGTYTCQSDTVGGGCKVGVGFQYNKCDSGYRPGDECSQFNFTNCKGTFTCIKDTGKSSCEADFGGTCKSITCGPGETLVGTLGQLGCAGGTLCCSSANVCQTKYSGTCKTACGPNETIAGGLNQLGCSGRCCIPKPDSSGVTCNGGNGINSAIGCIPFSDPNAFLGFILKWAIGVGGGIAFLLVVYSSFMITSSSGNPERLKAGQELLTSAIMGVILLVFSVFILKIIGVDILKVPWFGN